MHACRHVGSNTYESISCVHIYIYIYVEGLRTILAQAILGVEQCYWHPLVGILAAMDHAGAAAFASEKVRGCYEGAPSRTEARKLAAQVIGAIRHWLQAMDHSSVAMCFG